MTQAESSDQWGKVFTKCVMYTDKKNSQRTDKEMSVETV